MRVGLLIGQLSIGGAEGQLVELARRLDPPRFEPIVYSLTEAPPAARAALAAAGIPLRVVGERGWRRVHRLAAVLHADSIELVHAWLFIANAYAWAARRMGVRVPLVTSARNCKSQGWLSDVANRRAFRSSARIIANSAQVREYIVERFHAPAERVAVVHNGVDTVRFQPGPRPAHAPATVVTAGRFVDQKNPLLFVEAAARVHAVLPQVRFVMLGDGPLRPIARDRADRLGLAEHLELPGERYDVEAVFRDADVFWLTSSWEGLPNVVLEAMACGVPVVASDVGGTRELLRSGREGFLVRPHHVEDFVHYGVILLRDPVLRDGVGRAARQRAERFSLSRMAAETTAVYEAALAEPRPAPIVAVEHERPE